MARSSLRSSYFYVYSSFEACGSDPLPEGGLAATRSEGSYMTRISIFFAGSGKTRRTRPPEFTH
jgi:hypothetical protein